MKVEILAQGLQFPEGPAFDTEGRLWCVELHGGNLVMFHNSGIYKIPTGGSPNGLIFDKNGIAWFCDAGLNAIRCYNPEENKFWTMIDNFEGSPLDKPNDLAFDAEGNLLFTCPGNSRAEPSGYVCCLKTDGTLKKVIEHKFFPNGLAFMNDGKTLLLAETYKHRLWKCKWNSANCVCKNAEPWIEVGGPIGPDGMAVDTAGNVYVAVYGSKQVKKISKHSETVDTYEVNGSNPTNVAFDPSGRLGLIVTEAEKGLLISMPELGTGIELFRR